MQKSSKKSAILSWKGLMLAMLVAVPALAAGANAATGCFCEGGCPCDTDCDC